MRLRTGSIRTSLLAVTLAVSGAGAGVLSSPGTALAADQSYRSLATANDPDWMRAIPDSTSLASISIPGTHETMAIVGGSLVQTQENYGSNGRTLAAQLDAGIRMIDIRARINSGNTFTIHHGAFYQNANFDDVLNTLGAFLDRHPGETVVLRLKQECTGEFGSCTDATGQKNFADIFDMYRDNSPVARAKFWHTSTDRSAFAPTPELGTIRGKIVLAVLHGSRGGVIDRYGLAQFSDWHDGSSTWVQDNYSVPNIGAIATNPFLLTYLGQGTDVHAEVHRTGMVMMDFPGGGLINKIVAFNHNL